MTCDYNGGLTREQFLFFEIRIVAKFICDGLQREEILKREPVSISDRENDFFNRINVF